MGKVLSARQNFEPLVVPGLSVNSESSSSPSLGPEAPLVSGNKAAELATRRLGQESLRSDKKEESDPLADLPVLVRGFHR